MHEFSDLAGLAVDTAMDFFSVPATYTPPGGGSAVACNVLIDRAEREPAQFSAHANTDGYLVQVRVSELAAPVRGGQFAIGSAFYTIVGDPVLDLPYRKIWSCMTG